MPNKLKLLTLAFTSLLCCCLFTFTIAGFAYADVKPAPGVYSTGTSTAKYHCGQGSDSITVSVNIGCDGKGNAILDLTFAIIRFLSDGAGLVIVGSLVWGGIQYVTSRGDPQATAASKSRIENVLIALIVFVFAYAILNYLIPGQLLK